MLAIERLRWIIREEEYQSQEPSILVHELEKVIAVIEKLNKRTKTALNIMRDIKVRIAFIDHPKEPKDWSEVVRMMNQFQEHLCDCGMEGEMRFHHQLKCGIHCDICWSKLMINYAKGS